MLRYPLLRWGCALKDLQMVKPAPRQDDSIHSSCRGAGAFLGLMPGLCVRGVGFCSVCQGFERCVHALKACMVHGLEIGRVVVYAATSLSRTVKPMLEEPGGGAERAGRRGLSTAQMPPGEPRHHFSCHGLWQECASNSWQCRQPRLPERSPGASRSILRNR